MNYSTFADIKGPILFESDVFHDDRGFFMESYHKDKFNKIFKEEGYIPEFVQDNHAYSKKGVIRGLHFQLAQPQGKLVRCIRGEIIDYAVDIRTESDTFGKWIGVRLNDTNRKQLWLPRGFAHGYEVLSEEAEVTYKVDEIFIPKYDCGIIWDDKDLNINWKTENPIVSDKDKMLSNLSVVYEQ